MVGGFAAAGALLALGPVVIHLFHRRRQRTIEWAAMSLLRQALQQTRRRLQVRDLILLILRTAVVLLFGLAMARPYFTASGAAVSPDEPVHALVVIDNSLSMSYEQLGGNVLDEARVRARQALESLPAGSRVSVLPLCSAPPSLEPSTTVEEAIDSLPQIRAVDREASISRAFELAAEASEHVLEMPAKRLLLLTDRQKRNWDAVVPRANATAARNAQLLLVGAPEAENAWIESLTAPDGVADSQSPTSLVATVRYEGRDPRRNVEIALAIDGTTVASRLLDLIPGQPQRIEFAPLIEATGDAKGAAFVTAMVWLSADRLPADDRRNLVIPFVAGLPVVFVDALGSDEDVARQHFGETYRWRQLLAPRRSDAAASALRVRHTSPDALDDAMLAEARLVVVAGINPTASLVDRLRRFALEGGQLVVAAGGEFDPVVWQRLAWRDGQGILPSPLGAAPLGARAGQPVSTAKPLMVDSRSFDSNLFGADELSREQVADLFRGALVFQAIACDLSVQATTGSEKAAAADHPRILARLSDGHPLLIERTTGRGRVVFWASGLQTDTNTLALTNAVILWDRLTRRLLAASLQDRNLTTVERHIVPLEPEERRYRYVLRRPDGSDESLSPGAISGESFGLVLPRLEDRGVYRLSAHQPSDDITAKPLTSSAWAVNGPADESDLRPMDDEMLRGRWNELTGGAVHDANGASSGATSLRGFGSWKWMMALVLIGLLAELAIIHWTGQSTSGRAMPEPPVRSPA